MLNCPDPIYRPHLTEIGAEYVHNNIDRYKIGAIAPVCNVDYQSAQFPMFHTSEFRSVDDDSRADGAVYNQIQTSFGKGSYATEDKGLEIPIDRRQTKIHAKIFNLETAQTKLLITRLQNAYLKRVQNAYKNLNITATTTDWQNKSSAAVVTVISKQIQELATGCNCPVSEITLIIPRNIYNYMMGCAEFNELYRATYCVGDGIQPATLPEANVAAIFGVRKVFVPNWTSNNIFVALLAQPHDSMNEPSLLRNFSWVESDVPAENFDKDGVLCPVISSYDDIKRKSLVIRGSYDHCICVTANPNDLGKKITVTI